MSSYRMFDSKHFPANFTHKTFIVSFCTKNFSEKKYNPPATGKKKDVFHLKKKKQGYPMEHHYALVSSKAISPLGLHKKQQISLCEYFT